MCRSGAARGHRARHVPGGPRSWAVPVAPASPATARRSSRVSRAAS